jgi:predicted nucleic acid-binding Zn ribbon protein
MDRAGKLLRGLKIGGDSVSAEDLARAAWPQAVGPRIARHTRAVALRETAGQGQRLIVEVEDAVWKSQLEAMSAQILPRLREIAGRENVRSVEFRLGLPRRLPQRAASARPAADEADGIADPVLRRLYKASRKKSVS